MGLEIGERIELAEDRVAAVAVLFEIDDEGRHDRRGRGNEGLRVLNMEMVMGGEARYS